MSKASLSPEAQEVLQSKKTDLLSPLHHEGTNTQIKKLSLGKWLYHHGKKKKKNFAEFMQTCHLFQVLFYTYILDGNSSINVMKQCTTVICFPDMIVCMCAP